MTLAITVHMQRTLQRASLAKYGAQKICNIFAKFGYSLCSELYKAGR